MISAQPRRPDDGCRFPAYPWDLRTLIAVGAPGDPLRCLNLNWTLGRTGTRFDRCRDRSRRAARSVADLQFWLETDAGAITWKAEQPIASGVRYVRDATTLAMGDRLEVDGTGPSYRIHYRQPEAELELDVAVRTWERRHRWVRWPGIYAHHTQFASAQIRWRLGGDETVIELPALLDHGFGRALLPLRTPLQTFRYEVLRAPRAGYGLALRATGPLRIPVASCGVWRQDEVSQTTVGGARYAVDEWTSARNHAGEPRRVPQRWRGTLALGDQALVYDANLCGTPQPIFGDGFLQTFTWTGCGKKLGATTGVGYAEQLGRP